MTFTFIQIWYNYNLILVEFSKHNSFENVFAIRMWRRRCWAWWRRCARRCWKCRNFGLVYNTKKRNFSSSESWSQSSFSTITFIQQERLPKVINLNSNESALEVHQGLVIGPGPITRPPKWNSLSGRTRYRAKLNLSIRAKNGPITNYILSNSLAR